MADPNVSALDTFQLAVILGRWCLQDRDAVLGLVEVAGLMYRLEALWQRYQKAEPVAQRQARVAMLAGEQKGLDLSHDHLLRAVWFVCNARASYLRSLQPPRIEAALAVEELRDRLLPDGLAGTKFSYLKEESRAQQALRALKPADEPLLTEMSVAPGVTAWQLLHLMAERGSQLGDLDRARAAEAAPVEEPENLRILRGDMIKLISLVLELARTAEGPRDLIHRVTGQYNEAMNRLIRTTRAGATHPAGPVAPPADPASGDQPV